MKISAIVIASSLSATESKPMQTMEPCLDGIYPVADECNAFYQCAHGQRFPNQYCPEGLVFNGIDRCDYPQNVDCSRSENDKNHDHGDGACPDSHGMYPVKGQCNAFYQCAYGHRYPNQYCPEGLLFNGVDRCDYPQNVDCRRSETKKNEKNSENDCPEPHGMYPVKDECNAFYQCAYGERFPDQYCPEGLVFNGIDQCDYPENVDCNRSQSEDIIENNKDIECPEPHGMYPVKDECDAFYQCAYGERFPNQYCPEGLVFNGVDRCDFPANVNCQRSESHASQLQSEDCPEFHGMYPVEGDCSAFFQCAYGHRYPNQYCPDGLFFNGVDRCDYPGNVDCK